MSFVKSLLGGTQSKTNSSTPTGYDALPTQGQSALTDLWSQGQGLASNIAPFSNAENTALQNLSTPFMPNFNFGQQANSALGQVAPQVQYANSFLNKGAGQIDLSNSLLNQGTNPISSGEYNGSLNMFMNPYTNQVVDPAIRNIQQQADQQRSDIGALSSTNGAFGGTRQSLLESELGRNTSTAIGDVSGSLLSQGFNTASQQALQSLTDERNRYLTGANTAAGSAGTYGNFANTANQGASIYNQLGQNYLQGKQLVSGLANQSSLNALTAGQIQRDQPNQGLQLLQSLYGSTLLPLANGGTDSTSRGATPGLLQLAAQAAGGAKIPGLGA